MIYLERIYELENTSIIKIENFLSIQFLIELKQCLLFDLLWHEEFGKSSKATIIPKNRSRCIQGEIPFGYKVRNIILNKFLINF